MNTIELLNQFKSMGIQLCLNGSKIKYHIPEPVVKKYPELNQLLTELKTHKQEAIQLLQKNVFIVPDVMPMRAIMLWSDKLEDHFWWLIDKSALPEIQRDGVPIYDNEEIDIMLDAKDDHERKQLHVFKKIFGAKFYKAKGR